MNVRAFVLFAALMAFWPGVLANAATIDLFETPHAAETTVFAPPPQGAGSVANPTATAIGVERDLFVNKTGGADDERLRARINPIGATKLRVDADSQVTGSVYVTWDGIDANPSPFSGIDFNGLGGINLTLGANAFHVVASFSDVGGPILFSVFDNTGNSAASVATATLNLPGGIAPNVPTPFMVPFASFTGTTSALSNAGAILMEIRNTTGAWDLNLLSVSTVPEPTAFSMLGLLGLLLPLCRRRYRG